MGKRGPAPTPREVLAKRGSWRANKAKSQPTSGKGRPSRPDWLSTRAKRCWNDLIPQLETMGVLEKIDRNALIRYCETFAQWRAAIDFLNQRGSTYMTRTQTGQPAEMRSAPQFAHAMKASEVLSRIEREFGMTPSSRTSLGASAAEAKATKEDNPWAEFGLN